MREWPNVADGALSAGFSSFDSDSLAAAAEGVLLRPGSRPIAGGAVDSRRVEPGNAFFALPGERTDGHRFVVEARRAGAGAIVVQRAPSDDELSAIGDVAVVRVDETLLALRRVARVWRDRFNPL